MQHTSIAIFGEVLFDCFPDGRRVLGGAPFNVAWHLSAFGAAPRFISAVGDDADGKKVRQAMADWGMSEDGLQTDPAHATGKVQVQFHNGEPSYDIIADCAFDYIRPQDSDQAAGLLYHGTLALRQPVSAEALKGIKAQGQSVRFLDVNLREPWWSRDEALELVAEADWVKLNQDEFAQLAGTRTGDLTDRATDFHRRHGLTGLVITLGAEGALAIGADATLTRVAPSPALVVKDTVGAGDAFSSVLILGLVHAWPLATTLERAQAFASRIVGQQGAISADVALYRPFIEQWHLSAPANAAGP